MRLLDRWRNPDRYTLPTWCYRAVLDARDADVEALSQVNRLGDVARHSSHRPTVFMGRRTRRRSTMRQYQSVMMSCKRRNGSDIGSQPLLLFTARRAVLQQLLFPGSTRFWRRFGCERLGSR